MSEADRDSGSQWHLDKRVPIATLIAILGQAIALGWMASSMDGRLAALETFRNELSNAHVAERMAVEESKSAGVDAQFLKIEARLSRIDDKLEKIADRLESKAPR